MSIIISSTKFFSKEVGYRDSIKQKTRGFTVQVHIRNGVMQLCLCKIAGTQFRVQPHNYTEPRKIWMYFETYNTVEAIMDQGVGKVFVCRSPEI